TNPCTEAEGPSRASKQKWPVPPPRLNRPESGNNEHNTTRRWNHPDAARMHRRLRPRLRGLPSPVARHHPRPPRGGTSSLGISVLAVSINHAPRPARQHLVRSATSLS